MAICHAIAMTICHAVVMAIGDTVLVLPLLVAANTTGDGWILSVVTETQTQTGWVDVAVAEDEQS